ncbi:hypothetical protein HHK36_012071 [Tetracentron sinense]|uniref:Rieske domain-containing protein n=1 Tax=Tetracentron sinense TaxID=13715 RepID=A0A835DHT5_TETSI|nr:hypothetical protein HHK36_012071 [Tetracentron sinense]
MEASSFLSLHLSVIPTRPPPNHPFEKPIFYLPFTRQPTSSSSSICRIKTKFKSFSTVSSTEPIDPPAPEVEIQKDQEEKFDWFSQWYPVAPVCDLDKRVPHGKKIMGLDVVVWWDRNESKWQVFDDTCPHRLAPLSEGRIDQWGRLQCVYHGWCFGGTGDCKFIPQAHPDGPPVHTFKKACAAVYPSTMQNNIVWFWPSTNPQYKDILMKKKPPYISELDDPSFTSLMGSREIPYGYEILIENLMDPAHVPYAHYGIMPDQVWADSKFIPPCLFYAFPSLKEDLGSENTSSVRTKKRKSLLIFICIPVSPGNSRLIWSFPRNFGVWIDRIVPRWMIHIGQNLILDSDLYLLHLEERKIHDVGPPNWQKDCFVPTKSDGLVVGFRKWLRKYAGGQIDWGTKFSGTLPPTPPKQQLMDRYWSHVVNCSSCSVALKGLKVLEVALQVISIASIGIVAATKQGVMSMAARTTVVAMAVLCLAVSKWLSHFIYKTFYFHDYNHAFR